jgi:hypothetical protein
LVVLWTATTARAQPGNLVSGPSFDSEPSFLSNWTNLSPGKSWGALDFEADPSSGSVFIENSAPGSGVTQAVISTCFLVVPGATYEYGAWHFTPSPPQSDGAARLLLQFRESCPSGPFTGADEGVNSDALGQWTYFSDTAQAPPTAGGARIWVGAFKTNAGSVFSTYLDQVFVPEPDGVAAAACAALAAVRLRRLPRPGQPSRV